MALLCAIVRFLVGGWCSCCGSAAVYCLDGGLRHVAPLGRTAMGHGHDVRLIPANHVKPFVKRQKNDCADAAAIAAAASRRSRSFVAVKTAEKKERAVAFRTHQCLMRQRTQPINALRGHLVEFYLVALNGLIYLKHLQTALKIPDVDLPRPVREMGQIYLQQIDQLTEIITHLANEIETATKTDCELRRGCTVPGIGPVPAGTIAAFAPDLETFILFSARTVARE